MKGKNCYSWYKGYLIQLSDKEGTTSATIWKGDARVYYVETPKRIESLKKAKEYIDDDRN